ncbi:MAG TPA: hypothetical protein VI076_06985, partial [Actinopolymorphaceae bacterium]
MTKGGTTVCTFTNDDQPSAPTIAKSFEGLAHVGPGPVWSVSYLLTVDNTGQPREAEYTLFDVPSFASGIDIVGQSVVDVTGGGVAIPWDGQPTTPIVDGAVVAAGATHVYRVTFTVALTGVIPPDELDCTGQPGSGFFNSATLEWEGEQVDAEDCEPVPPTALFSKTVLSALQIDADTWDLSYRFSVTNPGTIDALYSLTDELGALPAGVTLVRITAMADPAYPLTPAPQITEWNSGDPVQFATGRTVPGGATHAYLITVRVDVDLIEVPDPLPPTCEDIPGATYVVPNRGSVNVNGVIIDDDACAQIDIVDLGIVKSHSDIEGGAVEPGTEFTYYLDVTNNGTVDVTDGVVTDEIPADLEVLEVTAPAGWTVVPPLDNSIRVEDVALAVGATDRIEVRVMLPQPPDPVAPQLGPDGEAAPFEPDFIDTLVNTACVAVLNDIDPTNDCSTVEIPVDEILADIAVRCVNDVAFLEYAVATSGSLQGQPITLTWTPDLQVPAPDPASVVRQLASGESGSILWPGALLAPNDVSIQWPGYRPLTEADYNPVTGELLVDPALVYNGMVLDTSYPTYPWRFGTTVTISVNPTLTISASYPPASPNCAVPRSADLIIDKTASVEETAPGASFDYGLKVTNLAVDSVAEPVVVTDPI